jgi:hypothetical protein
MRHQVTARISEADYQLLRALSAALQVSHVDVVTRGLAALRSTLSPAEQKIVRTLMRNAAAR